MKTEDKQKWCYEGHKSTEDLCQESKAYRIGKLILEIFEILKTDEDEE